MATLDIAELIRSALESADPSAFRDLLDPNVQWGAPGDLRPSCQNRDQVLAWYEHGRADGVRASVTEVIRTADKVLVGLRVTSGPADDDEPVDRWQVLTLNGNHIVDIRGYDNRGEACTDAGVAR